MVVRLGILMDPIEKINIQKDSSFAFLLAAQQRNYLLFYFTPQSLFAVNGTVYGQAQQLIVTESHTHWYNLSPAKKIPLHELDVLLMRKDPPFNMQYIYLTYLLELAESKGLLVINKPASLRDVNEKFYTSYFPSICTPQLISANIKLILEFLNTHQDIVVKPLDSMGGRSVFRLQIQECNTNAILENITSYGTQTIMAQQYIPELAEGDKRILLINGEAVPYALARIPSHNDLRGNLAVGANAIIKPLSKRDKEIAAIVGPTLREKGLWFVGLDVIGDYLTEINVTSPTGVREIEAQSKVDICGSFLACIEKLLKR